jgi:NAD(P)-dependent dehydrogenase (short-subunit alcohol dehydrogenase family)
VYSNHTSVISEREGRGVIVNVASMLGTVATSPMTPAPAYSGSKHGVMGITKTDAVMYAPQKVRINAMCPGYVETPLLLSATASGAMDHELTKVPMGRLAKMEEIGDSIVFLASPMSSFMTGHGLLVDGYVFLRTVLKTSGLTREQRLHLPIRLTMSSLYKSRKEKSTQTIQQFHCDIFPLCKT